MSLPFFSIIIPTFNRKKLLIDAIDSIFDQTYTDWEIVLIDDGSSDGTHAMINDYNNPRLRYFFQNNQGESSARNFGLLKSEGTYICFLDSDDYYFKNHLEILYKRIVEEDLPVGIFRTGMLLGNSGKSTDFFYTSENHLNPVVFFAKNFAGINSICAHRGCFKDDIFDIRFKLYPDTHLLLRILAKFPFFQIYEITTMYRYHEGRISNSIYLNENCEGMIENNINAIKSLFEENRNLFSNIIPSYLKEYLISEKFMDHAYGALAVGKYSLMTKLFIMALVHDKKMWFLGRYIRFLPKIPLKLLFNYPKLRVDE